MRCEVCGRKIFDKPFRAIIEGAKLTVCNECSKHATAEWEEPKPKVTVSKPKKTLLPLTVQSKKSQETTVDTSLELAEDFYSKIRQAREKFGISHEELGKKINEKVSLLRKIETGKIKPNNALATKLEHILKIKLIVPATEEKTSQAKIPKTVNREVTLGDLMKIDGKESEKGDKKKRKQS